MRYRVLLDMLKFEGVRLPRRSASFHLTFAMENNLSLVFRYP